LGLLTHQLRGGLVVDDGTWIDPKDPACGEEDVPGD